MLGDQEKFNNINSKHYFGNVLSLVKKLFCEGLVDARDFVHVKVLFDLPLRI